MDFSHSHRTVIKQFLFASAGVLFIPSSMREDDKPSIVLRNIGFNRKDEKLLSAFCDTLLPASDAPGAEDIAAHFFVMKMLDDSTRVDQEQKILRGLRHLNNMSAKKYARDFHACSFQQRTAILELIEAGREIPGDVSACYIAVKDLTIQAHTSSQYYLGDVLVYGSLANAV